jgi:hypothetical protein
VAPSRPLPETLEFSAPIALSYLQETPGHLIQVWEAEKAREWMCPQARAQSVYTQPVCDSLLFLSPTGALTC